MPAYHRARAVPRFELLERRDCPATTMTDSNNNMTITGTIDPLGLEIDVIANDTVVIYDGGVAITGAVTVNNIRIYSSSAAETVNLDMNGNILSGSLTWDGGSGIDDFNLLTAGSLLGSLTLTRVDGMISLTQTGQFIGGNVSVNNSNDNNNTTFNAADLTVGGYINVSTGNGTDTVTFSNSITGGGVTLNLRNGDNNIDLTNGSSIGGNLYAATGSGDDTIDIDTLTLNGSATFSLGAALAGGNSLTVISSTVNRTISIQGGLGTDDVVLGGAGADGNTFGGSLFITLVGGTDSANVYNNIFGTSNLGLTYNGGAGVDTLTYNPNAGSARIRVTAIFGAGNDILRLPDYATPAAPSYLDVDFGAGADSVVGVTPANTPGGLALINYPYRFRNLP